MHNLFNSEFELREITIRTGALAACIHILGLDKSEDGMCVLKLDIIVFFRLVFTMKMEQCL